MTDSAQLVKLATEKFGLISRPERKMLEAIANGQVMNFSAVAPKQTNIIDEVTQRTISADLLRWLCTSTEARRFIPSPGIIIVFGIITRELNLRGANIPYVLGLEKCALKDGLNMRDAQIQNLSLNGTFCKYILADRLKVNGSIYFRFGFQSAGPVILANSSIKGDLDCTAGSFLSRSNAVKSDITGHPHYSLDRSGVALALDRSVIEGDAFLRLGFQSKGQVRLAGAVIHGTLDCRAGCFFNQREAALWAPLLKVGGSAQFSFDDYKKQAFETNGDIVLRGATIGGGLSFNKAKFYSAMRNGVEAQNALVTGPFVWRDVETNKTTRLRLSHTKVGQLYDDEKSWPRKNRLSINGLTYDDVRGAPIESEKRNRWLRSKLLWLNRQPRNDFSLQPYRQLAELLSRSGYEENAKTVLEKMYDVRRHRGGLGIWGFITSLILKWTIGYGYRSHRAVIWALGFILLGGFIFYLGNQHGLMIPSKPDNQIQFNSIAYSIDTFLPIINLRQDDTWGPKSTDPIGFLIQIYQWFHILLGWLLTTLAIVGFTGLVKKS